MKFKSHSQEQPLAVSWHSFYQQQQQEGEAATADTTQQTQQTQGDGQQQQQEEDPLKDFPTDNLDDASKAALEKVKLTLANQSKQQRELLDRHQRLEKTAARYQSDAARALNVLKRHNLDDNTGGSNKIAKTPQQEQEETLTMKFMEKGLNEGQAKAYAQIFMVGMDVLKPGILGEVGSVLGPTVSKLNIIAADRYLQAYGQNGSSQMALKVPGVMDGARQILDMMIQNRQDITETSVDTAIKIALGEAMMKGGGTIPKEQTPPINQNNNTSSLLATLFGGSVGGGGGVIPPTTGGNGGNRGAAPVPANEDTARAATALIAVMDREVKKKN